jgi:hypothetical protein
MLKADPTKPGQVLVSTWILVGLRLALALMIGFTARLGWLVHHAEKWDSPRMTPILFFGELPFFIALAFVFSSQNRRRVVGGAAIAFISALTGVLLALVLFIGAWGAIWDTGDHYRYLIAIEKFVPFYFIGSVLLLVSALRLFTADRKSFALVCGVALTYCFLALLLLGSVSVPGSGHAKVKKSYDVPTQTVDNLVPRIRALTACLVRHHAIHPETEFPSSLKAIGADWHCEYGIANQVSF